MSPFSSEISNEIAVVNPSAGEMAINSDQMKISVEDLQRLASELNGVVRNFKI